MHKLIRLKDFKKYLKNYISYYFIKKYRKYSLRSPLKYFETNYFENCKRHFNLVKPF